MSRLSVDQYIAAPRERVFAFSSDFANATETVEAITKMEILANPHPEGTVGVGTRFRETRVLFGREATEVMEVTEFEAPHRYLLKAESHGCRYLSELRFEEEDGGTRATMTFNADPLTFFAKVMSFLTGPIMKSTLRKCVVKDLEDLKKVAEAPA